MDQILAPWLTDVIVNGFKIGSVFAVLLVVEALFSRERHSWTSRLRAAFVWLLYIPISTALYLVTHGALVSLGWTPPLKLDLTGWVLAPIIATAINDFFYYWTHRAQHRFFWRYHAVHHSIRELNAVNSYHHWTEELTRIPLSMIPMTLLVQIDAGSIPYMATGLLLLNYYLHTPTKIHFGPLCALISDNRFHRIHHSLEERHWDKNFCGFTPIWDILFGTAYFPAKDEWPKTGLADRPEPQTPSQWFIHPWASHQRP